MKRTPERLLTFGKAQISAFLGGMTDYFTMIFFTEVFLIHYSVSVGIGGIVGAIVNFTINKRWSFHSQAKTYKHRGIQQLLRFSVVVVNSILLKALGTTLLTELLNINYAISRLITDLFVSIVFNYMLQSRWVFRKDCSGNHPKDISGT